LVMAAMVRGSLRDAVRGMVRALDAAAPAQRRKNRSG